MILDKEIMFNVSNKNKAHLTNKGYDTTQKEVLIKVEDLPRFSHYKIKVKCDICGKEKELMYHKYLKNTKDNTLDYACSQKCSIDKLMNTFMINYGCVSSRNPDVKLKQRNTNNRLYGGNSPQCDKDVKEKSYDTMIERYGVKYPNQCEAIKNKMMINIDDIVRRTNITKVLRGVMVDYNNFSSFQDYRKLVNIETRKNKKRLFNEWNGFDYYDNELIMENLAFNNYLDADFPTIDHKISILNGFLDNIDPYEIGGFDNLCITKRTNNSKKHSRNELIFTL